MTAKPASLSSATGPLALMLVLAISGVTLTPACHAPAHPTQPVIDCIGGSTPGIVTNILQTLSAWNRDVADGGCRVPAIGAGSGTPTEATYDWDCIEASAVGKGLQVGGCALAEFVQQYLAPPAGRAAPSGSESVLARAHLERYRREHAGGAAFKTKLGDL